MFAETLTGRDDVIGIACEGALGEEDLTRMHALLHERLEAGARPGLVVDLTGFEGYEGFAALREDVKMEAVHRNDFDRIAVIGERRWMEWGTALAGALTRAEIRWFDAAEAGRAADWAAGGGA